MSKHIRRRAAALAYEATDDRAPRLLARGEGLVAERIVEAARREGIPIHENAAVVDVLSRIDLEREIPPELYRVVAEILAVVFRADRVAAANPR
ncbi:MAG: EscU/YscU/HrcU family type III secretion system export apparatus switch protein [Vicinamibacterales bacterium]